jgi:citrate synthase
MPLLTAAQTATRLGVKLNTVYAYVSRGLLEKHVAKDGSSRFDSRQVEQLARRGRPRVSSQETSISMLIESGLTQLTDTALRYRGYPTADLIRTHTFEEVAELLWSGVVQHNAQPWIAQPLTTLDVPLDQQLRVLVAQVPDASPSSSAPASRNVISAGKALIASAVDSLPKVGPPRVSRLTLEHRVVTNTIAARLWPVLCDRPPTKALVGLLNAALILMADHELATSSLAVRVAASTRASPSAAVLAGLGAMQGPLHGGASRAARELMHDAMGRGAAAAVTDRLKRKERIAGFGHRVYVGADPRAVLLLDLLRQAMPRSRVLAVADDIAREMRKHIELEPNVDLALIAIELATDMQLHASEMIFSVARMAGWLAHAMEEYNEPALRFRARAHYVGPTGT